MSRDQVFISGRWKGLFAPDCDDIAEMAEEALTVIPEPLRSRLQNVLISVEEFPDDEIIAAMGLESPFDLLGLYQGISPDQKSKFDLMDDPDLVLLFRRPILDYWCESEDSLDAVVRHVLVHEIGHHFGFSDEDIAEMEQEVSNETSRTRH